MHAVCINREANDDSDTLLVKSLKEYNPDWYKLNGDRMPTWRQDLKAYEGWPTDNYVPADAGSLKARGRRSLGAGGIRTAARARLRATNLKARLASKADGHRATALKADDPRATSLEAGFRATVLKTMTMTTIDLR